MSWLSDIFSTPTPPPAPDYAPIVGALQGQAAIGNQHAQNQYTWAQQQFNANKGQVEPIISNFEQSQNANMGAANDAYAQYKNLYEPLNKQQVDFANYWGSDENLERMRGRAESGVAQNFESQRQDVTRDLESYGINPGAVRFAGLDTGVRAQMAAAQAAAGSQSDVQTQLTANQLRTQQQQVGSLLPGQAIGETGAAVGAGNAAIGGGLNLTASGVNSMGSPTAWYGGGSAALGSAANVMDTGFKDQLAAYNAQKTNSSGLGTLAGLGAGLMLADEGGAVPTSSSPSQGKAIDDVPARLNVGEFVMPRDVTQHYGTDKLQKMIHKARGTKPGKTPDARPKMKQAIPMAPTYRSAA